MAAILMPDINLRRRRRHLERYWRHVLKEERAEFPALRPLLAPSPRSALDSRLPSTRPINSATLTRVASPRSCHSCRALSLQMQRIATPVTARLDNMAGDDACASGNTTTVRHAKHSERSLSVDNNQDSADSALDAIDSSNLAPSSASHSDSATSTRTMGLQRGQGLVSARTGPCLAAPTATVKRIQVVHSPGPTLGDVMEAVALNETDVDELDFSFLLKRGKRLGVEGCTSVARALETNQTVRRLIIREHDIGDQGALAIAAMLCRNSTLEYVDLCGNNISDAGAVAIAQALYGHASLTHLLLWSNSITDDGAMALADAIKCNCSLLYLGLVQNAVALAGCRALLDALEVNAHIETLNLATNEGVPEWMLAQIRAVLARNRLEAPRMAAAWDLEAAPESPSAYSQENALCHDSTEQSVRSCSSASGRSEFLSCSDATSSAISGDGIWI